VGAFKEPIVGGFDKEFDVKSDCPITLIAD
jgi:hypothetical protein